MARRYPAVAAIVGTLLSLWGCGAGPPVPLPLPSTAAALPSATAAALTTTPAPTAPPWATSPGCLGRANFIDPADSPYILPYPAGRSYRVSQSYCNASGSHHDQLAYDFDMPAGDPVTAARAGVVVEAWDGHPDDGQGHHNYVFIKHDDGTVAFYAHLMQGSVTVKIGEHVEAGQRIAASGHSGTTGGPHLHFGVYASWPPREGHDVPVTFRNAEGRLYASGALIAGQAYRALPP